MHGPRLSPLEHGAPDALVAGVVLAASLILTPLVRAYALRRGWYDLPDDPRRVHTRPPRASAASPCIWPS